MIRKICAENVRKGQWIIDCIGGSAPLCVVEVSSNSLGNVILRCSYSGPDAYPSASLVLLPEELVTVERR